MRFGRFVLGLTVRKIEEPMGNSQTSQPRDLTGKAAQPVGVGSPLHNLKPTDTLGSIRSHRGYRLAAKIILDDLGDLLGRAFPNDPSLEAAANVVFETIGDRTTSESMLKEADGRAEDIEDFSDIEVVIAGIKPPASIFIILISLSVDLDSSCFLLLC